ncbi:hypothetical protein [Chitinophaga sp. 212800008-4]|uniref:hypothetical protein n=1 Tax=unclassified Chitinophaga TaxID=2619133 RepID=UPI0030D0526E
MKKIAIKKAILMAGAAMMLLTACRKNNYYIDGGLSGQSAAEMQMTVYDFLASRADHQFDSLIKIIDLTNSKTLVNQPNITFFALNNKAVQRFQLNFKPDDRQGARPLDEIGKDTLVKLLGRFIIPNMRISLEQAVKDGQKYYAAVNGDSLYIAGKGGGTGVSSSLQTSAYRLEFTHVKIPGTDTVQFVGNMQTHNLVTANAMVHVMDNRASFAAGFKQKYFR